MAFWSAVLNRPVALTPLTVVRAALKSDELVPITKPMLSRPVVQWFSVVEPAVKFVPT
jgi:hypothetical protein